MKHAFALEEGQWLDTSHLVTEDDEPVDNPFQERQSRLLVECLYANWLEIKFLAFADVALFHSIRGPAIVPDVMVSLGVLPLTDPEHMELHKSYFTWEYGKAPDLVVEIVSNRDGGEEGKLVRYAQAGVPYYVIYDPMSLLSSLPIRIFQLSGGIYVETVRNYKIPSLNLGFKIWEGSYDGVPGSYLRFTDVDGNLLASKGEKALMEQARADEQRARADEQRARADEQQARADEQQARADEQQARADRLSQKLRELGLEE